MLQGGHISPRMEAIFYHMEDRKSKKPAEARRKTGGEDAHYRSLPFV
jgi:hypothetical protein